MLSAKVRSPPRTSSFAYETVWQLTSTVTAQVRRATSLIDLFNALFPCGSVTGALKISSMKIIEGLEGGRADRTAAMVSASDRSAAGSESQVMPPPVP